MTGQANDIQWYIARDGKQHGPLTDIEMRTFVAHSYLRQTDLIWRPGMAEWLPAPTLFPAVFQQAAALPAPAPSPAPIAVVQQPAHTSDFDAEPDYQPAPGRGLLKRLAVAAGIMTIIGGGAFAVATYREPLLRIVSGGSKPPAKIETVAAPEAVKEAPPTPAAAAAADASGLGGPVADSAKPADATGANGGETQTAAIEPIPEVSAPPAAPPSIDGSAIDARLQKIPAWVLIKKDYPDWYVGHIAAAEKLSADKKPDGDIAMHLAQGLVTLRRQNAEKALAASPDKLRRVATTFLDHLKFLRTQSVSACYGFISKGEVSPAVVQSMQTPESATAFNAQISAIFEAISEGTRSPAKHEAAVKGDYDVLIKELGKLGWKEEDLQTFSNPRLLSKREPEQVCKMVQDWFTAHLAVKDQTVRDRLLYETLKPVVSG